MKNIVLLLCVFLIFSCNEKSLIIVTDDDHEEIKVNEDDPRVSDIWDDGETFIDNKSSKSVYLEDVEYSTSSFNFSVPTTHEIFPNTIYSTEKTIDYVFTSPPSTVKISRGESVTKWWLYR